MIPQASQYLGKNRYFVSSILSKQIEHLRICSEKQRAVFFLCSSCGRFVSEDFGPSNAVSQPPCGSPGATNPSDTPWPTARRNMMNPYHPQAGLAWLIPNGQEFYMENFMILECFHIPNDWFDRIEQFVDLYIPRTQLTPIFEGQPSKTRSRRR